MKKATIYIALICYAFTYFAACTDNRDDGISAPGEKSIFESDPDNAGFILFHSNGSSIFLGTNDLSAKSNEYPQMKVSFSYDFSIEKHETTCGEFISAIEKEGKKKPSFATCDNDSLPITNVTYYDAVLYANTVSKNNHFDTVYSYSETSFDSEGHCIGIEGLNFHPEKKGFRLPLEAEWMFVASQGWNTKKAWTADNANGQAHNICQQEQNKAGICDLEGNVREWVNDWLSLFIEDSIVDYVGAPNGNSLGERIIKGGYYNSDPNSIQPYNRGDTYVITGATHTKYVGFRLAIGSISNPTWLSNNGKITTDKITAIANSANIRKKTGTYNVKLAFRNDLTENLTFIDYSNGTTFFSEITDSIPVYHPEISPNGKHVAFCTKIEGVPGKSQLYVRDLNKDGANLIRLDVESAAIPRWRVSNGDTTIIYVSSANTNNSETFTTDASTWQVPFVNGKFGTPQKLFHGAYHGGVSEDNNLAVTGATLLRARITANDSYKDTIWYNGEQACNASLAKDGSKRTLFLDFASETGRNFVEEKYRVHERLFIADSTGKLIQSIKAPSGYSFDHSEWAFDNNIIATLCDNNGNHKKIVLINTTDSSITELAEGIDLWHPCLWVSNESTFTDVSAEQDSAGIYMNPNDEWGSVLMRYNMELLWKYFDTLNVAILGSSRPLYSISPTLFSSNFFTVNFAHTPNSIYSSRDFLNHYIFTHSSNLRYIILSLDIDFWYKTEKSDNYFTTTAQRYPGYLYDANHDYWKDGIPKGLLSATENGLQVEDDYVYLDDRGRYLSTYCQGWGNGLAEIEIDSTFYDNKPELINNSITALKEIIQSAANRNIYVIGVIFPQSPKYKNTGAFGRYGLRRSTAKALIEELNDLSTFFPNFILMDENKMGDHDYTDNMATDYDHLCEVGGQQITARLDSLLRTLR